MKHYLIGDVAKLLPISKDTLRYYDKLGIVSPKKSTQNNYRYYTREDLLALSYVLILRDLELSLEEIKGLICNNSLEGFHLLLDRQEQVINAKLTKLQRLKKNLCFFKDDILKVQNHFRKIDCIMSPPFVYKTLSSEFDPNYTDIMTEMEETPYVSAPVFSALLSQDTFFAKNQFDLLVISGLTDEQMVSLHPKTYGYFKPTLCLRTILIIGETISEEDFQLINNYLTKYELTLNGDILARCIAFEHCNETPIEYYELFIPIKN
ncbi:MAG: MerR family transcriptional regulator [Niameybacter sp.]|uniref:MerR family transcriptional regulator n=1 Tax=Niameybacter sp. TaxID=2033640 RepID=UPI002FCB82A5